MRVYLYGGMHGNWRKRLIEGCPNHVFLCPLPLGKFDTQDEWWTYDKALINSAQVGFGYIEKGKWCPAGALIETGVLYGQRKPIILANERSCDGQKKKDETDEEQTARYIKCMESFADIVFIALDPAIEYLREWEH